MSKDTQNTPADPAHRKRRGFTIIELMVVLFIVTILGSQTVPTMADAWDKFMLRRIAAKVMVIISLARQHAIADERATLIHFKHNTWCIQYQDEAEAECSLGKGSLPPQYFFNDRIGYTFTLLYTAGRGFSPLSAGAARLFSQRSSKHVYFINSSVGRVRLCSAYAIPGIESC